MLPLLLLACAPAPSPAAGEPPIALPISPGWRPALHASVPVGWMNDPNGLAWFDGRWHLFYQHNPDAPVWGPMHWRHAVSDDLLVWEDLGVALAPDPTLGQAFSGSAIVADALCEGCLHAFLTHDGGSDGTQKQSLAVSSDGHAFTLYDGNPVVPNPGVGDFRDPKVFRHGDGHVMVVAAGDHVRIYVSDDLTTWTEASRFGPAGLDVGVWECPDLFPVLDDGVERWVLQVDTNPGGAQGGSGAHWFVGTFDGATFEGELAGYVDHGADFYAAQSWSDVPDGRRIWTAWASNWQYALFLPTGDWRGVMALPREVSMVGGALAQAPVRELADRRTLLLEVGLVSPEQVDLTGIGGDVLDIELEVTGAGALAVFVGDGEETRIAWSPGELAVDRTASGTVSFSEPFPARHAAPIPEVEVLDLRVVVDRSIVEVFALDGTVVLTELVFPSPESTGLRIEGDGLVQRLSVYRLDP